MKLQNAERTLNILKHLLLPNGVNKRNKSSQHSKLSLAPFWITPTPYGVLSYQIPTSKNCKPCRTQLCALLLATHSTSAQQNQGPSNTHVKIHATQPKQLIQAQTHPLRHLKTNSEI